MKILALDTSLNACSVALVESATGAALAGESEAMARGHAEALMPMVSRVMAASGLRFPDIDRFAVTIGPGTFTGIRVGLAAGRGFALACGRPLIGVGTLEALGAALASGAQGPGLPFAVALDARRGEVYLQPFDARGRAIEPPCALAPQGAARHLEGRVSSLHGSGATLVSEAAADLGLPVLPAGKLPPGPDAVAIARLAATRPEPKAPPKPLYLRAPDARPQSAALARRFAASPQDRRGAGA